MSLSRFLKRAKWHRERREEIESYVQIETDENVARGMPHGDARAAALRKFGNPALIQEEVYRMNSIAILDSIARDARHALRLLRRSPTFTAAALLTLAIGIGANTAVFSVVDGVLLKPLPYPDSDRLVAIAHTAPGAVGLGDFSANLPLSPSMYFTYAEHNSAFQSLGVWLPATETVTGTAEPEQVRTVFVSEGVLESLGVAPIAGRWISHADQTPTAPAQREFAGGDHILLGYGFWQRRFGGDRSVIGRTLTVDSRPRQIIGVMPKGFRIVSDDADLIEPMGFIRSQLQLQGFGFEALGRLKPGVSISQAGADLAHLLPLWMRSWPAAPGVNPLGYETWRITPALRPLKQSVVGNVAGAIWLVMATIGMVMLIACANVANLMLVRAEARQQDLAVRAALGAGWLRIARELLVESAVLALLGGGAGLGIAYAGIRLVVALAPANLPRVDEISLDAGVLGFTFALSLVSGILFGSIPAIKYAGRRIALGGRTFSAGRERHRARNSLVIAQVALALVLLVSSGLMIRTFQALRHVEPGFTNPEQIQTMRIAIPPSLIGPAQQVARMQHDIADRLSAIPGVASVAFINSMPLEGGAPDWDCVRAEGRSYPNGEIPPLRTYKYISPGLFAAIGTRLIAGRDITWTEFHSAAPVAIVSENLARDLWGAAAAAPGKRIAACIPTAPWREVVGVVQDVHEKGLQNPAPPIVYWPSYTQGLYVPTRPTLMRDVRFVIRSPRAGSAALLKQIQQAVWAVNGNLPLASVRTMDEIYSQSLASTSFALVMLAIAGAMALLMGIVGIYGVIAYAVSQRTREIGIRLALGAQQGRLRLAFVGQALALAGLGVIIGLAAAAALSHVMKSLLYGVSTLDPLTFSAVPVLLVVVSLAASYWPARKAARVDPVQALKTE